MSVMCIDLILQQITASDLQNDLQALYKVIMKLGARLLVDLFSILVLVKLIYHRLYKRNDLFFQVKRFVLELQPKTFIIENVDGLLKGPMKGVFNKIMEDLLTLNYRIRWKSMNSLYYGVPQSRQRLIIMGVRNDLDKEPVFPDHNVNIQFIGDVINNINFHSRGQFDRKLKNINSFAYTITKTPSMFFIENGVKRQPTIEELKILQGFPEDFKLVGSFNEQWGLIGNSVPPPLSKKLGETILSKILN